MIMSSPSSFLFFFFLLLSTFLFHSSHPSTILIDGTSQWENPTVRIGDSIVFKHKQHYNLYIFQNQRAFNLCNFSQATLLTNPNTSSFTWHPSRTGFFYFTFNDGSFKACQASQKLAIKVDGSALPPTMSPATSPASSRHNGGGMPVISSNPAAPLPAGEVSPSPAPAPESGGEISPPPTTIPWPFHPSAGPSTDKGGGGMPFINSNPAVPLPTGEVDSATIRPLPTSDTQGQVMIGIYGFQIGLLSITLLLLQL